MSSQSAVQWLSPHHPVLRVSAHHVQYEPSAFISQSASMVASILPDTAWSLLGVTRCIKPRSHTHSQGCRVKGVRTCQDHTRCGRYSGFFLPLGVFWPGVHMFVCIYSFLFFEFTRYIYLCIVWSLYFYTSPVGVKFLVMFYMIWMMCVLVCVCYV